MGLGLGLGLGLGSGRGLGLGSGDLIDAEMVGRYRRDIGEI